MSEGPSYPEKLKLAVHLLFFKRGRKPGAREWELKSILGKRYEEILKDLNEYLNSLDLEVYGFEEGEGRSKVEGSDHGKRYLARLKGTLLPREAKLLGWRRDNLSALAIALTMIISKQGKVERSDIERIIGDKLGRWRCMTLVDSMIRNGYLIEDKDGMLSLGWRTQAEVDLNVLMTSILSSSPSTEPKRMD